VFSELENVTGYSDMPCPGVLYIHKTVRDPKAPGGAKFELEHNKSSGPRSFSSVNQGRRPKRRKAG